jgi:hypothetical protein
MSKEHNGLLVKITVLKILMLWHEDGFGSLDRTIAMELVMVSDISREFTNLLHG